MSSPGYVKALGMLKQVQQQKAAVAPHTLPPHLRGKTRNVPRRLGPQVAQGSLNLAVLANRPLARKTRKNRKMRKSRRGSSRRA